VRIREHESSFEQAPRHNSSALQHQFRLGAQEQRSYLEHPLRCRHTDANAPRLAQHLHEFVVWDRIRRGDIDNALALVVRDQPADGADEIQFVHPRHELTAIANPSTLPTSHQREQRIEHTSPIRTHRHCRAQRHFANARY